MRKRDSDDEFVVDPEFEALIDEVAPVDSLFWPFEKDETLDPDDEFLMEDDEGEDEEPPVSEAPTIRMSDLRRPMSSHHRHTRSQIRDAKERAVRRAKKRARMIGFQMGDESTTRFVNSITADRTPCSCSRCGNWRRWWGIKPIQEQRIDISDVADEVDLTEDPRVPRERLSNEYIREMAGIYEEHLGDLGGYIEGYFDPDDYDFEDRELSEMWREARDLIVSIRGKLSL